MIQCDGDTVAFLILNIMRSKLHLKGHPLHPILVGFPIAFFIGTLIFDFLGWTQNNETYWRTGMLLEISGIISALLAAVPGIVDYFLVVPPRSSAKTRAAKHGIINVIMLIIFICVWLYRRKNEPSSIIILSAEAIGVILMGI